VPGDGIPRRRAGEKLENPLMRGPLETNSKRYAALAEKFEAARKRPRTGSA